MTERRYLLLDRRVVERADGVRLRVGKAVKDRANPLFGEDRPWEPRYDNLYPNVTWEKGLYRCWYSPFTVDPGTAKVPPGQRRRVPYPAGRMGEREMGVCYAESHDGRHWTKPELDLVRWQGRRSNVLARGPHGAGVFRDEHDPDRSRRYKMVLRDRDGMAAAFSTDGLLWSRPVVLPDLSVEGDTHNNALWAPTLGRYVCITRTWERRARGKIRGIRLVARSESTDFLHWSRPREVFRGRVDHLQLYSMPVLHHAGVYLGLPAVFDLRTDRVHTELAWSPDTVHWHRVEPGVPLIGNSRRRGAYDWGCVYASAYPVCLPGRILLYYAGSDDTHMSWRAGHLCLATLRPDGFAAYEPRRRRGAVTTRPLPWTGGPVLVTADVRAGGSVRVELLDAQGRTAACGRPIRRTATDRVVRWETAPVVRGRRARLRFVLEKAGLYSFCLSDAPAG